ncbi:hypothetical protein ElyMa_005738200 [Elysia marginata]|uniref:Yippee domain-containing protein n=1 Tax=Elysia marginata TaxID=1093978 RepID=A0AAV4FKJ1_9GAST|nr:hypothetical protein ElyMa_005738200 [Elysia marginata]
MAMSSTRPTLRAWSGRRARATGILSFSHDLGRMNVRCEHCGAKRNLFNGPKAVPKLRNLFNSHAAPDCFTGTQKGKVVHFFPQILRVFH